MANNNREEGGNRQEGSTNTNREEGNRGGNR